MKKNYLFAPFKNDDEKIDAFNYLDKNLLSKNDRIQLTTPNNHQINTRRPHGASLLDEYFLFRWNGQHLLIHQRIGEAVHPTHFVLEVELHGVDLAFVEGGRIGQLAGD